MRRCYWGLWPHPSETAVRWFGWYRPACYRHRANVELTVIEARRLKRMFEVTAERVMAVLDTPAEQIDEWARKLVGRS